jgi:hypothetical protein
MLAQVIHADNHCDYVTDFMLDSLIKSKEIVKFKSSTGWITIGAYPIMENKPDMVFNGADRIAVNDSIFVRENLRVNP